MDQFVEMQKADPWLRTRKKQHRNTADVCYNAGCRRVSVFEIDSMCRNVFTLGLASQPEPGTDTGFQIKYVILKVTFADFLSLCRTTIS